MKPVLIDKANDLSGFTSDSESKYILNAANRCWHDSANDETVYDDDKDFKGEPEGSEWDEFGYVDRWETVMVAFTEKGCEEYLRLNGHNDRRQAHNGEVRIYVESFNRCPEMIAIREALMANPKVSDAGTLASTTKDAIPRRSLD